MVAIDIFTREIIRDALVAIGDEMFNAMLRTSMSPIIYETADFAVGATDAAGNLLAQGNGVTGFLASLDSGVQRLLELYPGPDDIRPGDVFIANSPHEGGGTHLSDVMILLPVFHSDRLIAWTVNKAHWTEIGDSQRIALGITVLCLYVILFNRLFWRRLYDLAAERLRLD